MPISKLNNNHIIQTLFTSNNGRICFRLCVVPRVTFSVRFTGNKLTGQIHNVFHDMFKRSHYAAAYSMKKTHNAYIIRNMSKNQWDTEENDLGPLHIFNPFSQDSYAFFNQNHYNRIMTPYVPLHERLSIAMEMQKFYGIGTSASSNVIESCNNPLSSENQSGLITENSTDTPEVTEMISYLPLNYIKKDIISGILMLTPKERALLYDTSHLGIEFRSIMRTLFAKVIYHSTIGFNSTEWKDRLGGGIENIFGTLDNLVISKELSKVIGDRLCSFIQHITTYVFAHNKFSYEMLQSVNQDHGISCESYKRGCIAILTFIELMYLKKLKELLQNNTKFNVQYNLADHENLGQMNTYYSKEQSLEDTGQVHSDLLMCYDVSESHLTVFYGKLYLDFKSYITVGIDKSRSSLFHPTKKILLKLMSDIETSLKRFIKENQIPATHRISKIYREITDIKISSNTDVEKYNLMMTQFVKLLFYPDSKELKLGFAIIPSADKEFALFYDTVLKPHLKTIVDSTQTLEKLFPLSSVLDKDSYKKHIEALVLEVFPEMMHKQILEKLNEIFITAS